MSKNIGELAYWKGRLLSADVWHTCFPEDKRGKEDWQMCVRQVEILERKAFNGKEVK